MAEPVGLPLATRSPSEAKALDSAYQHVLDCVQKSFNANGKDAKTFLSDLQSAMICWGCDIRVETDSLESIRGTMFESVIRSTFDRMMVLLQQYEGNGSSEDLALQTELEHCARRLESFVSPIRMSQVIETGNGPLDGMRRKITELSELPKKQSDLEIRTKPPRREMYIIARGDNPDVGLGSIMTDPFDPKSTLVEKRKMHEMPKPVVIQIPEEQAREKFLEGKGTIWQAYLDTAEPRSTSRRSSKNSLLDRAKFESHYFQPNDVDLSKTLSSFPIRAYLDRSRRGPMYMVTGVRIMWDASDIHRGQKNIKGIAGTNTGAYGVPVTIGPDVSASPKETMSEISPGFIYAYKVSQIIPRYKFREKQFDKGAFLSDEQDDEESEINSWELLTPEIETIEEYGEDAKGKVLMSNEDDY